MATHKLYTSDVSELEWALVVLYVCMLPDEGGQRVYNLRAVQRVTGESVDLASADQGDTGARRPPMRRPTTGSSRRSRSWRKRDEGLRGCRAVGSWSGRSLGRHGSTAWHEITTDCC